MLDKLVSDAREIGYKAILLDTLPFLKTAIRMYHEYGFYNIPSYNNSPMENLLYMRYDLLGQQTLSGGYTMKRKVIAMCGSMKFMDKIQEMAERLELEQGYVVLGMVSHVLDRDLTENEKEMLGQLHLEKINLADGIFVVNVGGYIGQAVKKEIEYAKARGKEIFYLEP